MLLFDEPERAWELDKKSTSNNTMAKTKTLNVVSTRNLRFYRSHFKPLAHQEPIKTVKVVTKGLKLDMLSSFKTFRASWPRWASLPMNHGCHQPPMTTMKTTTTTASSDGGLPKEMMHPKKHRRPPNVKRRP